MKKTFSISLLVVILLCGCSEKKTESDGSETIHKNEAKELIGMFTYFADAAIFVDCESQKKFPVAMEQDYIVLEREYLSLAEAGNPIMVVVIGRIISRPKVDGEGEVATLIIEELKNIWRGKNCNDSIEKATLTNRPWKLAELEGIKINVKKGSEGAYFILKENDNTLSGFGGCNNFMGSYKLEENHIKIGPLAGTRKFCADKMEIENKFLNILEIADRIEIIKEILTLYQEETPLARFF